jgi:GntR family transcriptional regulator
MRYLDLADALRARVAAGEVGPGGALASEAELSREYGASRVTVRRALDQLRREGLVVSRRGSGWFAALDPVRQPLGRVTTVEAAVEAAGARPSRRILSFAFVPAPPSVVSAFSPADDAEVLRVERVNLADDEPFALVTVWIRADLGAGLSRADVERAPFYDLLPLRGVALGHAQQTITAELATANVAQLLDVDTGAPLLLVRRTTYDDAGAAILYSEHRYPAGRTTFEIDFSLNAGVLQHA